jgi:hypothetical protein
LRLLHRLLTSARKLKHICQNTAIVMVIDAVSIVMNHGEDQMSMFKILAACATVLTMAGSSAAMAETSRGGSITGPKGKTYVTQGAASCTKGTRSCSYGGSITGPGAKSWTRSGTATANGSGGVSSSTSYAGPRGRTGTRTGSVQIN